MKTRKEFQEGLVVGQETSYSSTYKNWKSAEEKARKLQEQLNSVCEQLEEKTVECNNRAARVEILLSANNDLEQRFEQSEVLFEKLNAELKQFRDAYRLDAYRLRVMRAALSLDVDVLAP